MNGSGWMDSPLHALRVLHGHGFALSPQAR